MRKRIDLHYSKKTLEHLNIDYHLPEEVLNHMEVHNYSKGEIICYTGTALEYFSILSKGKFKVYTVHENGKSLLLRFYEPGHVIGDMEYFNDKIANCHVEAINDVELLAIPFNILEEKTKENNEFLIFICQSLSKKLKNASNSSSINLTYNLENRFASYLLATLDEASKEALTAEKFSDLADLLGTTYRHLNRVINSFIERDIIEKNGKKIIVKDIDAVVSLAGDVYK